MAILSGLSGSKIQASQVYTNIKGLAELKYQAKTNRNAALHEVAKQFEAIFMNMVMKSMRDASMGDSLFGNSQSKMFTDLHDKQLGLKMTSSGGLGLAKLIVAQLSGNGGAGSQTDSSRLKSDQLAPGQLDSKSDTRVQLIRQSKAFGLNLQSKAGLGNK